jgi:hypothetical protein
MYEELLYSPGTNLSCDIVDEGADHLDVVTRHYLVQNLENLALNQRGIMN